MAALCAIFNPTPAYAIAADDSAAVIFLYQRVGDDSVPQSNVTLEQFEEHIRELKDDGYSVLPLEKVIDAAKSGAPLPQKTVAITFDGAYQSTLQNAIPVLEREGYPYTVFYASDLIDAETPGHLSWAQLKKLDKNKLATLGILPGTYVHMVDDTPEKNAARLNNAVEKYRDAFDKNPLFFAWPYGEYSTGLKKQIESYGFKAAFAQHSGVTFSGADFMALPRFTMTESYGGIDRFRRTANALPLPVSDIMPVDPIISQNPPMIGFTVSNDLQNISKLSCFLSGVGKVELTKAGANRVEIRLQNPLLDRRTRMNCTMPAETVIPGEDPVWRWFGMQMVDIENSEEDGTPDNGGLE